MIIQLADAIFAIATMLVALVVAVYCACFTVVAVDGWGVRHRQRSLAREGIRAIEREHRRRRHDDLRDGDH